MPIYNDDDGRPVVHFGHGDIAISPAKMADRPFCDELVFIQHDNPHPIGSYHKVFEGKSSLVIENTRVRLAFDKVESIDVVIERLTKLRAIMEAKNDDVEYQDPPAPKPKRRPRKERKG